MATKDDLETRADELVNFASTNAISLHTALGNQFPAVLNVPLATWNIVVTIASVCVAITCLKEMGLPAERESDLLGRVERHLIRLNKNAVSGIEDCKAFFERTYPARVASEIDDRKFAGSDTTGTWIAWNTIRPRVD
jgi:hypothetical protein